jgi:hypothetical protein
MARAYRVRGIPLEWDIDRVVTFLAENSHTEPPLLNSVAREIHGRSQTATVTFQSTANPPPRQIQLPATKQLGRSQVVTIDDDFYGITTLYTPASQNHKIECVGPVSLV